MCVIDENAFDYRRLSPEQWDTLKRQLMHRAHVARAQTLRDVIDGGVRALRTAAISTFIRALAEATITTAGKWWRGYALWRERKAAVRQLRALDDRTLRDIGVNRSEIEWVVYGRDATRLRDASIAANRARPRDARSGATARPRQASKPPIRKSAA
jgi:uncharacterized protein YjiS (DUF1127 family)